MGQEVATVKAEAIAPKESKGTPGEIRRLQVSLKDIDSRLGKLEAAILSTPSKALEIPLLQRDIENIKVAQQSGVASLRDSVDRVYDLNKWLLGAMAVSIISLALATFLKGKNVGQ
ncbi:MAG TPA: hypothetical protein VMT62_02920 [Syntrophorhabdaceae bacterium]|nr:hypothetical protein [Syntrophorhabdaceae bacterium]